MFCVLTILSGLTDMAGDWISITHELPDKPEVLAIAGELSITRFEVVGRLHVLWRWFDQHTKDGHANSVTLVTLSSCIFGDELGAMFVQAVKNVNWLIENSAGISVPNFEKHISETAKTRAMSRNRKQKQRSSTQKEVTQEEGQMSRSLRDRCVTTEQNRTEHIKQLPITVSRAENNLHDTAERFTINLDWVPQNLCAFDDRLVSSGVMMTTDAWLQKLPEFVTYWAGRPEEKHNTYGWENKFLKSLKSSQTYMESKIA